MGVRLATQYAGHTVSCTQRGAMLALIFGYLKLVIFEYKASCFHFTLDLSNYVANLVIFYDVFIILF